MRKLSLLVVGLLLAASGLNAPSAAASQPSDPIAAILATSPTTASLRAMSRDAQLDHLVRCVDLDHSSYCILLGFVSPGVTRAQVAHNLRSALHGPGLRGGAASLSTLVAQRASMSSTVRRAAERREIAAAVAHAHKAQVIERLRHGYFPKAIHRSTSGMSHRASFAPSIADSCDPSPCGTPTGYSMMSGYDTQQLEGNFCGPATMQMIDWAGDNTKNSQYAIASDWLDTGAPGINNPGTSLSSMVGAVNAHTSWDNNAGAYISQSVVGWSASQFLNTHVGHIYSLYAPIVEHVKLWDQYYTYLDHDHGGHFQVGRGYDTTNDTIRLFEPFDERDFSSTGNATAGPHSVSASNVLAATKADYSNFGI